MSKYLAFVSHISLYVHSGFHAVVAVLRMSILEGLCVNSTECVCGQLSLVKSA